MRSPRGALRALTMLVLGLALPTSAQDADAAHLAEQETALRARVSADDGAGRTGTGARCELGFVLVRLHRATEAIVELDREIADLGAPSTDAMRRRLASCLYNRGRAAEDLDDVAGARSAYERSLALRPSAPVRARLDALPRETAEETAMRVALELCRQDDSVLACATSPDRVRAVADSAGASDVQWFVVETTGHMEGGPSCAGWVGVAVRGGAGFAETIYGYCFANDEDVRVTPAIHALEGAGRGAVMRYVSRWGEYEGAPGGSAAGVVVLWLAPAGMAQFSIATGGDDAAYELDVEVDDSGQLTITRVSGRVPAESRRLVGRHTVAALQRLAAP